MKSSRRIIKDIFKKTSASETYNYPRMLVIEYKLYKLYESEII